MLNNNFLDFEQTKPAFVAFKIKYFYQPQLCTIIIIKFQILFDSFKIYYECIYEGNKVVI